MPSRWPRCCRRHWRRWPSSTSPRVQAGARRKPCHARPEPTWPSPTRRARWSPPAAGWPANALPAPDARPDLDIDEEEPCYDVVRPVRLAGQTLATLHFGVDLSPIRVARRPAAPGLAIAGGEMLLSAGLLGVLGLLITRQLSRLTSAALQVEGRPGSLPCRKGAMTSAGWGGVQHHAALHRRAGARSDRAKDEAAHMAATLRERGAQLDAIFALSPDGFVSFDSAGRVGFVNPAFCHMSALSTRCWAWTRPPSRGAWPACARLQSGFAGLATLRAASAR